MGTGKRLLVAFSGDFDALTAGKEGEQPLFCLAVVKGCT